MGGDMGNIVLNIPLAPTGFTTLWNDEERFYKSYLKRFDGKWIDTGDAGMIDEDGYIHVMSRSDDIINVAAHRFSTGSIEKATSRSRSSHSPRPTIHFPPSPLTNSLARSKSSSAPRSAPLRHSAA